MLDIKYVEEHKAAIVQAAKNKNIEIDINQFLKVGREKNELQVLLNKLQEKKNKLAKEAKGEKPSPEIIERGRKIKKEIEIEKKEFQRINEKYLDLAAKIPNFTSEDTPVGKDEKDNKEIVRWGKLPSFDFKFKSYLELAKDLDLFDFERGAKVSGYRGYYVKNEAVMLQMGLMMYALKKLIQKGFTPMIPPTLVKEFALFGSGYFTGRKFSPADEIYKIENKDKLSDGTIQKENKFLIGTAEPSLLAYYSGETLKESQLPLKICGFSQCYRSEIGSYGKDTKGIYRVHEFMKVEQVCLTKANIEESNKLHEEIIEISKEIHEELQLPYRQLAICTGDMGPGKYKMYDMEAWIPSREEWGETGSASNFLDWQARRLNVSYRNKKGEKKYVHMLNNTALASPRTMIAIIENHQNKDGSITVPKVLRSYVGQKKIRPSK